MNNLFYFLVVVVTICKGEKRICLEERDRDRETDGEKERDVLLGARPDWVCRGGRRLGVAPARDARGGKPRGVWIARRRHSFDRGGKRRFQTVGACYLSGEILLFFCRRPSKMMMCVPFRLVSSNTTTTTTTTSACVSLREEASSDATARLGEDGQTERARRCFLAVRAHLFFFFFFFDADSNRLWERWRRTENVKQIRWREDERVILTYLPTTNFSLSLSLVCVCCLY